MPIRKSQATGWLHDDYKVQREFERLGKQVSKNSVDAAKANTLGGLGGVGEDGNPIVQTEQELSILHNENYVSEKIVREICFEDNRVDGTTFYPIDLKFNTTEETLTLDKRSKVHIKLEARVNSEYFQTEHQIEKDFHYLMFENGQELFLGTIEPNCRIDSIYLNVKSPMSSGELEVYTTPDSLVILPGSVVPIDLVNVYHKNYTIKTLSNSDIFLKFVGSEPTRGFGTITIFYHKVQ